MKSMAASWSSFGLCHSGDTTPNPVKPYHQEGERNETQQISAKAVPVRRRIKRIMRRGPFVDGGVDVHQQAAHYRDQDAGDGAAGDVTRSEQYTGTFVGFRHELILGHFNM